MKSLLGNAASNINSVGFLMRLDVIQQQWHATFKMKLFSETLMHIMLTTIQIYVHNIYTYRVCTVKYGIF